MSEFKHLLPPNVSSTERALEITMAEPLQGLERPISELWNVDTCPEHLLPWMAWAFSVEVWDHAWPHTLKRNVIRSSIEVHRWKGTRRAVELALEALEMRIDLHEGFELDEQGDPYGPPHTFTLDAFAEDVFDAGFQIDPKLHALVTALIHNVKPVRSHFTLRIGEKHEANVAVRSGSRQRFKDERHVVPALPRYTHSSQLATRSGLRQRAVSHHFHSFNMGGAA